MLRLSMPLRSMSIYITPRQLLRKPCVAGSISRDPVVIQHRAFNLMYSALTKEHRTNHKLKAYVPFNTTPETACQLELWNSHARKKIGLVTLDELLEKYLQPGVILLRKNEPVKGEAPPYPHQYILKHLKTHTAPKNMAPTLSGQSKGRRVKQVFIHTWADMKYCNLKLHWAYHMLLQSRLPVEFHVTEKKVGDKDFRTSRRLTEDLIHLRPEVIQRAMPENAAIIINPLTNYTEYCWVVGPPQKACEGKSQKPHNINRKLIRNRSIQLSNESEARQKASEGVVKDPQKDSEGVVKEWKNVIRPVYAVRVDGDGGRDG
ncbi:hypothetical protein LPUS_10669 [Lasallia pustulata]|uniref:Uncharacterized protein n=1 Tax=Lasallia pustulata TaxID=136370 RepID=A0A1W5DAI3_9LECA|nr:hypothetical protein LPUS_10669 [Lasallia pustulata]